MIGDVNLFLKGAPTDADFEAELEIMIAGMPPSPSSSQAHCPSEPRYRRSGRAHAALELLLAYVTAPPLALPPSSLVVRIGEANAPSVALFARLGFVETKRVEVFQEVEMRFRGEARWPAGRRVEIADC